MWRLASLGFFDDIEHVGLVPDVLLSTWDLRPFTTDLDFLVAVLSPSSPII